MFNKLALSKILFIDIETVPFQASYKDLDKEWKSLWDRKAEFLSRNEDDDPNSLYQRAGIYAEFGKVVCVSLGFLVLKGEKREFRLKSIHGEDEKELLTKVSEVFNRFYNGPDCLLCAHNGKEFDFPYLSRRMLINGLKLPHLLDIAGRKPWEVQHLDTMQLWRFGDYKHYTSLKLLCKLFDIPSPKTDMDGSQVAQVFYEEKDLDRISEYCREDTLSVAQLLLRYLGEDQIQREEITLV